MVKFNDPSTSFANKRKGLSLRLWSMTYMKSASEEIVLKAFLTDFTDEYTSNWTEDVVYGRMDPLSVFQNTQRVANISLDIPAASKGEAQRNLIKIQKLVKGVYPVYETVDKTPVLSGAPLWRIKLSNLLTSTYMVNTSAKLGGLTCKLSGVSFTPDLEPGMYIHNGKMFPKNIKLSLTCTIFHDHTVGFDNLKRFQSKNGLNFPYAAGPPQRGEKSKVTGGRTVIVDGAPMSAGQDFNDVEFTAEDINKSLPQDGTNPPPEQSTSKSPADPDPPQDGTPNRDKPGITQSLSKIAQQSLLEGK